MSSDSEDVTQVNKSVLRFGIASKGRMHEQVVAYFNTLGIPLQRTGIRSYSAEWLLFPEIEIVFISAAEIAQKLISGEIHVGITGQDLLEENQGALSSELVLEMTSALPFSCAHLVLAVPECWVDVVTMADLDDVVADLRDKYGVPLRVATKYPYLTRRFFKKHGISGYSVVESQSATEGLPARGDADVIVDITSTGMTLSTNHLKVPDDGGILCSSATFAASVQADWNELNLLVLKRFIMFYESAVKKSHGPMYRLTACDGAEDNMRQVIEEVTKMGACVVLNSDVNGVQVAEVSCEDANVSYNVISYLMLQHGVCVGVHYPERYIDGKPNGAYEKLVKMVMCRNK